MMSCGIYRKVAAFCTTRMSASIFQTASRVVGCKTVLGGSPIYNGFQPFLLPLQLQHQQQQIRCKMTKAKKKRNIRWRKRQAWAAKGKEVPKPANFIPVETPVENHVPRALVEDEIRQADEQDRMELERRRSILMQQTPLRHHMTGMTMNERVQKLFDMKNGNQMEVVAFQKRSGMSLFEMREGDTGSTAVQIVALTARIQQLQTHMRTHHKDKSIKRGLLILTVRRRKLLDYLERKQFELYRRVVKSLGLARR